MIRREIYPYVSIWALIIVLRYLTHFHKCSCAIVRAGDGGRNGCRARCRNKYYSWITIDDVLNSPVVAYPLRALDCCLMSVGAACTILCYAFWNGKRLVFEFGIGVLPGT